MANWVGDAKPGTLVVIGAVVGLALSYSFTQLVAILVR